MHRASFLRCYRKERLPGGTDETGFFISTHALIRLLLLRHLNMHKHRAKGGAIIYAV
jgi:hypothetical protein